MEKTHAEVSKKITEVEKQKTSTEEGIKTAKERLGKAKTLQLELNRDIEAMRTQRQSALVTGEESVATQVSKKLKEVEAEVELKNDEIVGLEAHLVKLNRESETLTYEAKRLDIRALQLHTITLAAKYNELAKQMASVVRELNETNWEIEREGRGLVHGDPKVVFHLEEGAMINIPRLLFDEDAPDLGEFVSKHPGVYPSNLKPVERCFYDKVSHFNEMLQGRKVA